MTEKKIDHSKTNGTRTARSVVKYLRISPRKMRLVINTVRWKPVAEAFGNLMALNKKAARLVEKSLKSAVANAKGKGLEESRLIVSEIKADGGPMLKRFMARSMGRADQILKRSTHLTVVLREEERSFGSPPASPEAEAKAKKEKPKKEKKVARQAKTRQAAAKA
jgi:large subunit ribosomal protein L22